MAATIVESEASLQRDFIQQSNTAMRETAESVCQVAAVTVGPGESQDAAREKAPRGARELSSSAKGKRKLLATPAPVVLEEPDADQRAIRRATLERAIDGVARWPYRLRTRQR